MNVTRHTLLLLAIAVALAIPTVAVAQETTTGDEVLQRYDSERTQQMSKQFAADRAREEQLDEEIDALTEAGEFGEERDAKREELLEIEDETEAANALGDSRFRDIQDAPVEGSDEKKVSELKRKADSLYELQNWANDAPIDINSELYYWSAAEKKGDEYRAEAEALEAAASAVPEKTTEQTIAETTETTAAAAPGSGGGEEQPEPTPEEVPEAPVDEPSSGPGFLSFLDGINLVPIAFFILLVGAAIFALSKSAGLSVGKFFSPAMAEVKKRPQKPAPKPKPKTKAATNTRPSKRANLEDSEPEERRTKKPKPEVPEDDEMPDAAFDSEELQRWFEKELGDDEDDDEGGDDDLPDYEDPRL